MTTHRLLFEQQVQCSALAVVLKLLGGKFLRDALRNQVGDRHRDDADDEHVDHRIDRRQRIRLTH
jgi:hypothetical protein